MQVIGRISANDDDNKVSRLQIRRVGIFRTSWFMSASERGNVENASLVTSSCLVDTPSVLYFGVDIRTKYITWLIYKLSNS